MIPCSLCGREHRNHLCLQDSKDSTIASASLLVLRGSQADKHQLSALLASWSSSRDPGFCKGAWAPEDTGGRVCDTRWHQH